MAREVPECSTVQLHHAKRGHCHLLVATNEINGINNGKTWKRRVVRKRMLSPSSFSPLSPPPTRTTPPPSPHIHPTPSPISLLPHSPPSFSPTSPTPSPPFSPLSLSQFRPTFFIFTCDSNFLLVWSKTLSLLSLMCVSLNVFLVILSFAFFASIFYRSSLIPPLISPLFLHLLKIRSFKRRIFTLMWLTLNWMNSWKTCFAVETLKGQEEQGYVRMLSGSLVFSFSFLWFLMLTKCLDVCCSFSFVSAHPFRYSDVFSLLFSQTFFSSFSFLSLPLCPPPPPPLSPPLPPLSLVPPTLSFSPVSTLSPPFPSSHPFSHPPTSSLNGLAEFKDQINNSFLTHTHHSSSEWRVKLVSA